MEKDFVEGHHEPSQGRAAHLCAWSGELAARCNQQCRGGLPESTVEFKLTASILEVVVA